MTFPGNFPKGGVFTGGIKSIQRGTASGSGDVTITPVNPNKTEVRSFSTGCAGQVAGVGTSNAMSPGAASLASWGGGATEATTSFPSYSGTVSPGTTTGLFAAQYGAILKDSKTITCSGACEWEVVEYA